MTAAELSRKLQVSYSVVKRWKQVCEQGAGTAVAADSVVVPPQRLWGVGLRTRELEQAQGSKALGMEILPAARARAGRLAGGPKRPLATPD